MKDYISSIAMPFKLLLILICSVVLGTLSLSFVYLLPVNQMFEHVKESSYVFQIEGYYPAVDNSHDIILDNWTDSVMLNNAIYPGMGENVLTKSVSVNRIVYSELDPVDELLNYTSGNSLGLETQVEAYPRYWHGYLVILKPLLLFMSYLGIRSINGVLVWGVLVAACIGFIKQKKTIFIIPFIISILCLRPDAVAYSMQFSSSYYTMMLAAIIMLFAHQKLLKSCRYYYFFFIVGILIAFFDFLTYPLITLGVPMTLFLILDEDDSWKVKLTNVIKYSICWGLGYAGMWASKWGVASLIIGKNCFADAFGTMKFRVAGHVGENAFSRMDVILRNYSYFASYKFFTILMLAFLIVLLITICKSPKKALSKISPLLLVACMPIVWYFILGNHSYIHSWMTYRTFVIFAFAFLSMVVQSFEIIKHYGRGQKGRHLRK